MACCEVDVVPELFKGFRMRKSNTNFMSVRPVCNRVSLLGLSLKSVGARFLKSDKNNSEFT